MACAPVPSDLMHNHALEAPGLARLVRSPGVLDRQREIPKRVGLERAGLPTGMRPDAATQGTPLAPAPAKTGSLDGAESVERPREHLTRRTCRFASRVTAAF